MFETADRWLLRALYAGGSGPAWLDVVSLVTFLGSGWMMLGLLPPLFWRRLRVPTAMLIVSLGVTSGVVAAIKVLAGRVRPCHALAWAHALPIALPTDPSFPSGHAAGSFAFAAFVFANHRRAGIALGGVAVAIALSRVALGVHYPSDVAAGAILGLLVGRLGARRSARYALAPATTSTAVGLADADAEAVGQ